MTTLAYSWLNFPDVDLSLHLQSADAPPKGEWDTMVKELYDYGSKTGHLGRLRVLVVMDSGGPNAAQRDQLVKFYQHHNQAVKSSIVTSSTVARGIVTAISWFNPDMKAFSPQNMTDAASHLDIAGAQCESIVRKLQVMQKGLTRPVKTLDDLVKALPATSRRTG